MVCSHPDYITSVTPVVIEPGSSQAIDVELELAGKISGKVTTAKDGQPIEGIQVTAFKETEGVWEPVANDVSAAEGIYTIAGLPADAVGYRIEFADPFYNHVPQFYDGAESIETAEDVPVEAGVTTWGIDAALQEFGSIGGTVTSATDSAPIAGAWVTAYQQMGGYWEPISGTETEPDGTYRLGGLVDGAYRIEFVDPIGNHALEYYDDAKTVEAATSLNVTVGEAISGIDASLDVGGQISGTVTAAVDGAPVPEVFITIYRNVGGSWRPLSIGVVTDEEGSYTIGGLPTGAYRVEFGDWSGRFASEFYNGKPTLKTATAIGVRAGGITRNVNASLDLASKISGTVLAASDDAPAAGVWVEAFRRVGNKWEWASSAETSSDGGYVIEGLSAGTYRVSFFDPAGKLVSEYYDGKASLAKATYVTVAAGSETTGIDAKLDPAGFISGTVSAEPDGSPVEYAMAIAYRYVDNRWEPFSGAETRSDGTYTIGGLSSGTYRVEFFDWSGALAGEFYDDVSEIGSAAGVSVTQGSITSGIDATLSAAGKIAGTVTSAADGSPVMGFALAYRNNGGRWEPYSSAEIGPDGSYEIGGLNDGAYKVQFIGYEDRYQTEYWDGKPTLNKANQISVTVGMTTPDIDATLNPVSVKGKTTGATAGPSLPEVFRSITGRRPRSRPGAYL